ncbi:MAG: transcriptional repressor [Lachnospiraceae bacterium]|nr:transcriptional repressor [Lachnospiraceae bacterium]
MEENKKIEEYPAGLKWTKQRKRVYQILKEATEPLSAAQIYARMETWEQEQYAISTIYRILAAFEENKLIEKTTWMGEGTVVYELKHPGHVHYAVCLDCHKRIPLEHCPLHMSGVHVHSSGEENHSDDETDGFAVVSHKIELYGYCKECQAKR